MKKILLLLSLLCFLEIQSFDDIQWKKIAGPYENEVRCIASINAISLRGTNQFQCKKNEQGQYEIWHMFINNKY